MSDNSTTNPTVDLTDDEFKYIEASPDKEKAMKEILAKRGVVGGRKKRSNKKSKSKQSKRKNKKSRKRGGAHVCSRQVCNGTSCRSQKYIAQLFCNPGDEAYY